ncbi:MAG: hypothetical protein IJY09_03320, partial [Lachnospiraceae bacterium]|nr:hypothetical protein [Lachnospiraceae bacterium]
MEWFKGKWILFVAIVFVSVFGAFFCKKEEVVSENIPVVLYSDSAQNYSLHGVKHMLIIEGKIIKRLFRADVFEGEIYLEGHEEMKQAVKVVGGFRIKDNTMEYVYQDGTIQQNVKLLWNEKRDRLVLCFTQNERNGEPLDTYLAVGACDSLSEAKVCLSEIEIIGMNTAVSYEEKLLREVLVNEAGTGFTFRGAEAASEGELQQNMVLLTEDTAKKCLAIDSVKVMPGDGAGSEISFAFRFRSVEEMQEAYTVFQNALNVSELSDVEKQQYLDGRSSYTAQDGSVLEVSVDKRRMRFDVTIRRVGGEAENGIFKFEYSKELESKLAAEDLKQLKERLQGEFALEILEQTEAGLHVRVVA